MFEKLCNYKLKSTKNWQDWLLNCRGQHLQAPSVGSPESLEIRVTYPETSVHAWGERSNKCTKQDWNDVNMLFLAPELAVVFWPEKSIANYTYLRVSCHRKLLFLLYRRSGRIIVVSTHAHSNRLIGYLMRLLKVSTYKKERPNVQTSIIIVIRSQKNTLMHFQIKDQY